MAERVQSGVRMWYSSAVGYIILYIHIYIYICDGFLHIYIYRFTVIYIYIYRYLHINIFKKYSTCFSRLSFFNRMVLYILAVPWFSLLSRW